MFRHVEISNRAVLEATLARWKTEALAIGDEGVFLANDAERQLYSLHKRDEEDENIHGYFLVKSGDDFASAILELSHALPKSKRAWLKLLNITLRPALLPSDGKTMEIMKESYKVLAHAITKSIRLIFVEHPSRVLKIYGRTDGMRSLFAVVVSIGKLDTTLKEMGLSAKIEGNWLVITRV